MTGTLHKDLCTFMIISCPVLRRMRNVSYRSSMKHQNTHFMFNNFSKIRASFRQCGKNTVQPDRPQMTIKNGAFALHTG
jgi:hypothetical protein